MNKFAEITVIEFKNGKDVDSWESDNDLRIGTVKGKVLNKTQILWDDDNSVEWVKTDNLRKHDKENYILTRAAETPEPQESPKTPEKPRTSRKRTTAPEKAETE